MTDEVADGCEQALPPEWLWQGRHIYLVDGTTVSMPDTEANQQAYPQQTTQPPGLGVPLARMVVLLSLAMAMTSGMALAPYCGKQSGETALFRELFDRLSKGDIVLFDRYYSSYFMITLLLQAGVDVVSRLHQLRTADFRRGRRLGCGDHIVEWPRPHRPDWMDPQTYALIPESICIREVQVRVQQSGFRTESFVVITTVLDAETCTRQDIAELYHKRWFVEVYQPECPSSAPLYQLAA